MTQTSVPASGAPAALSLTQRFLGVLFSPQPTFASVAAHPKWLGVLVLSMLIGVTSFSLFLSTEVGKQAFIDQAISRMERNGPVTPEQEARVTNGFPIFRSIGIAVVVVFGLLIPVVIAGIAIGVFNAGLGGNATFKQVFAIVTHAGVVHAVTGPLIVVLNYVRQTMSSATNLGVFVPMLDESNVIARFLGSIDLIWIWYLAILAIGLGVLYRRKGSSIFMSFVGVYVGIALIVAIVRSAMGGS
jgi:hypothetical protein